MRRPLLITLLLALVALAVGVAMLGAFPPDPHVQPVQKVLPNDRFNHGT